MIDQIRGLPNVYTVVSPAAYRAQTEKSADSASPHLHHSRDESAGVTVSLSQEALALVRGDTSGGNGRDQGSAESKMEADARDSNAAPETGLGEQPAASTAAPTGNEESAGSEELSQDEKRQVTELKARDREVRAHEQAHLAAAGDLATSGASFEYQSGPDGKRYAIGGEVSITVKEGDDPEETILNAQQAQRAALAPADPSAQDRRVAAQAAGMAAEARREEAGLDITEETNAEPAPAVAETQARKAPGMPPQGAQVQATAGKKEEKPAVSETTAPVQNSVNTPAGEDPMQTADTAAAGVRGRMIFNRLAQAERGYGFGFVFSSMSLAA